MNLDQTRPTTRWIDGSSPLDLNLSNNPWIKEGWPFFGKQILCLNKIRHAFKHCSPKFVTIWLRRLHAMDDEKTKFFSSMSYLNHGGLNMKVSNSREKAFSWGKESQMTLVEIGIGNSLCCELKRTEQVIDSACLSAIEHFHNYCYLLKSKTLSYKRMS